jgi:AcrR family transcriptional regulator
VEFVDATVPADVREQVLAAARDELTHWGLERFNVAALAARHGIDESVIYRYWGSAQRVALDVLLRWSSEVIVAADTGSLRTDLHALAAAVANYVNSPLGRGLLRAMVIDDRAAYSDDTRMVFWAQRFSVMRVVFDRARDRGELRDGADTIGALQLLLSPLHVRALYSREPVDDE